jgi:hypothetical protein
LLQGLHLLVGLDLLGRLGLLLQQRLPPDLQLLLMLLVGLLLAQVLLGSADATELCEQLLAPHGLGLRVAAATLSMTMTTSLQHQAARTR